MSIRVDFYILQQQNIDAINPFVCRLLAKIYHHGHRALILLAKQEDAETFDEQLWTFSDTLFIPHLLGKEQKHYQRYCPVMITWLSEWQTHLQSWHMDPIVCINLTEQIDDHWVKDESINRIIEVVPQEEPWLSQSRQKYQHYRDHYSCDLHIHHINSL